MGSLELYGSSGAAGTKHSERLTSLSSSIDRISDPAREGGYPMGSQDAARTSPRKHRRRAPTDSNQTVEATDASRAERGVGLPLANRPARKPRGQTGQGLGNTRHGTKRSRLLHEPQRPRDATVRPTPAEGSEKSSNAFVLQPLPPTDTPHLHAYGPSSVSHTQPPQSPRGDVSPHKRGESTRPDNSAQERKHRPESPGKGPETLNRGRSSAKDSASPHAHPSDHKRPGLSDARASPCHDPWRQRA